MIFALNQTLHHQESLRAGDNSKPYTTDDLIKHYNCGDLNAVIFSHDTAQVFIPLEKCQSKSLNDVLQPSKSFRRRLAIVEPFPVLLDYYFYYLFLLLFLLLVLVISRARIYMHL